MPGYNGTNFYFDTYSNYGEQDLLHELTIEAIQQAGVDMMYIPRNINHYDELLVEDDQSSYTHAIPMAMYIKSVNGFEGDSDFFSKFGYEIRDQVEFTFAKRIWEQEVGALTGKSEPNLGDVIYFPLNNKLFQIKHVNYKPFFYQIGTLPSYDVTCELFEFSNELVQTGIAAIDRIRDDYSIDILDYVLRDTDGHPLVGTDGNYLVDTNYGANALIVNQQNDIVGRENVSNNVIDNTEIDPFNMKVI